MKSNNKDKKDNSEIEEEKPLPSGLSIIMAERLKRLRENKKFSHYQLEQLSGITRPTISALEDPTNDRMPRIDVLEALAKALGAPISYLIGENNSSSAGRLQERPWMVVTTPNGKTIRIYEAPDGITINID